MPLSKRARIEIYIPERETSDYALLENAFEQEFLHTFGGCTVIHVAKGLYRSESGSVDADDIDLIYADTSFETDADFAILSAYTDTLKAALLEATSEESILIVVHHIYHSV